MLKTRILTVVFLLPVVLACLFIAPSWAWGLFAALALGAGAWEWTRLASFDCKQAAAFIAGFALLAAAWLWLPLSQTWAIPVDALALLFWLAIVPLWLRNKWTLSHKPLAAMLGWLLLLAALMGVTRLQALQQGAWTLLSVLAIAWVADITAYFAGRAFGRRKLAPSISPGKSWEGVYGALVGVSVYAVLLHYWQAPLFGMLPLWLLLPLSWGLTALSVMGDLLESLFKRQAGLKDSSNLLPGHGGVLDRIDSLLALVPVSAALLFGYAALI